MTLQIHFTETFQGETVTLQLRGAERVEVADLQTDPRSGLARTVSLPAKAGGEVLEGRLKDGAPVSVPVDPEALKFVTAELRDGELQLTPVTKAEYAAEPRGFA